MSDTLSHLNTFLHCNTSQNIFTSKYIFTSIYIFTSQCIFTSQSIFKSQYPIASQERHFVLVVVILIIHFNSAARLYGAIVCGSCKIFFRRIVNAEKLPKCKTVSQNSCLFNKWTRNVCR